jgi:hypothetical protein
MLANPRFLFPEGVTGYPWCFFEAKRNMEETFGNLLFKTVHISLPTPEPFPQILVVVIQV